MFEKGNPKYVSGMSGTELAIEILNKSNRMLSFPEPQIEYEYSIDYWCGWILAYYQWKMSVSFRSIISNVSIVEIRKLYPTLHEVSEDKFVDTLNTIIRRKNKPSNLQIQRKRSGYSQSELSNISGVNLRTLQQYESKAKDINKASAKTVLALANALGSKVEDLLEYQFIDEE